MSFTKAYLRVSSADRDAKQSVSKSDFTVNLKETYNMQGIVNIQVHQCWVPNTFMNVNEFNNVFKITEQGEAQVAVTIPQGQYTQAEFVVALQLAINTALSAVATTTVAVIAKTSPTYPKVDEDKLLFTFTGNTVSLDYDKDSKTPTYTNINESALGVIGFIDPVATSATWNSPSIPNLRGYSNVYIHSKQINGGGMFDANSGTNSAFASVSFHDVPYGAMGYYQSGDTRLSTIKYSSAKNMSTLRIVLRDEQGNKLDIGASDMTVLLLVEF